MSGNVNSTGPVISINLPFTNDTDSLTELKYTIQRQDSIVPGNPSLYDCYVSRWYFDSTELESFRITSVNQNDYWVGIMNSNDSNISTSVSVKNLPTSDVIKLYGESDFLDIFNKTIANIYQFYRINLPGSPYVTKGNATFTNLFTDIAPTKVFTISNDGLTYPWGYDYQLQFKATYGVGTPTNCGYSLYLKNNTSNVKIMVVKDNLLANAGVKRTYLDSAYVAYDETVATEQSCYPINPFSVFKNTAGNLFSDWTLEIVTNGHSFFNWEITLSDVTLSVTARTTAGSTTPDSFYAPYLEIDDTTNKLQWRFNDLWLNGKFDLYFSPKLNSMLGYYTKYYPNINGSVGGYKLLLPSLSTANPPSQSNMLTFQQNISTVECFCDLESVNIETSLNLSREINSLSLKASDRILTSFIIEKYSPTNYSFTSTSNNLRKFRVLQTAEITNIDILFYIQRKNTKGNASKEVIKIAPGMYGDLLILFVPYNVN